MDKKIDKKKSTLLRVMLLTAAIISIVSVIYLSDFDLHSSSATVNTAGIHVATVASGPFYEFIPITGAVIPAKTFYLDTVEGGQVTAVHQEVGSQVEKGDRILTLTNAQLVAETMARRVELDAQRHQLENAQANLIQLELENRQAILALDHNIKQNSRTLAKHTQLAEEEFIPLATIEESEENLNYLIQQLALAQTSAKNKRSNEQNRIAQLKTAVRSATENLNIVKKRQEQLTLKAPVAGHLTALDAQFGEVKAAGQRLGQIDVMSDFVIRAKIDEHYIARVVPRLAGSTDISSKKYQLRVQKVYPEVINGQFEVDMVFEAQPPNDMRRGQTFHIRLALGKMSTQLLLPVGGFYNLTGGRWVFVLDDSKQFATRRSIRLGRKNAEHYEVLTGLNPGDQVITSSYESFEDQRKLTLAQ